MPAACRAHILPFATAALCAYVQPEAQQDRGKLQRHSELHAISAAACTTAATAAAGFVELDSFCLADVGILF